MIEMQRTTNIELGENKPITTNDGAFYNPCTIL